MKKDLFTFLISRESPPDELNLMVKKDIHLSFRKNSIVLRFLSFQLLGALFSLTFCPQFGVGFVKGHGIAHYFLQYGDWACATFCGSLFLSSGLVVSFIGMKGEELWWIWRRMKLQVILLPPVLWGGLMMTGSASETLVFHLSWMIAAIAVTWILLTLREKIYSGFQLHQSLKT